MDGYPENKFITAAGRASSIDEFANEVKKNLYDNYEIAAIHGLGEFGIDDKERYLAFITGESESGQTFTAQKEKLLVAQFGAQLHESVEKAFDYSKENYETFGEEEVEQQRKFEEMQERFPPITAGEREQFDILESLWANDKITFIRCILDGEPCMVLVAISTGAGELRVRPLAIMMNENIEIGLEFPGPDEEE